MQALTAFCFWTYRSVLLRLTFRSKTLLVGILYEKALRLSSASRIKFPAGHINSLINSDTTAVVAAISDASDVWAATVQIALSLYFLSTFLGSSTGISVAIYVFLSALQFLVAPKMTAHIKLYMKQLDGYTKKLREFLYGVKSIKYQAIEGALVTNIEKTRATQLHSLAWYNRTKIFISLCKTFQQSLFSTVSFIAFAALGGEMTASNVFTALGLFSTLVEPSSAISTSFPNLLATRVSFQRLQAFLTAQEAPPSDKVVPSRHMLGTDDAVVLDHASFKWDTMDTKKEGETKQSGLCDITLSIRKGTLTAVVGGVGSGKTTLLAAIAKSISKTEGSLQVNGTVALCEQQPWIMSGTILSNILFHDESRHENVQKAVTSVSLDRDLELLPSGIHTHIGEKGVNLSGGQKARVALARAVASDRDILLLDDPLSALDAHVGKAVLEQTILRDLKNKTVILLTHQLHTLPKADQIVVMAKGRIVQAGSYKSLMEDKEGPLFEMMRDYHVDEKNVKGKENVLEEIVQETKKNLADYEVSQGVAEDRRVGAVKPDVVAKYFGAGGALFLPMLILVNVLVLASGTTSRLFLAFWTSNRFDWEPARYLQVYLGIGIVDSVFNILALLVFFYFTFVAARELFTAALHGLQRATMGFFDEQPIGRIINRMTIDVRALDMAMSQILSNLSLNLIEVVISIIVISYSAPYLVIQFAILGAIETFIFLFFQASYRELKRLSSIMQSPITSHISESLSGINTIKAYGAERFFVTAEEQAMDQANSATLFLSSAQFWFGLRSDLLASTVTLVLVILSATGAFSSATVGLSLTASISLSRATIYFLLWLSNSEASFNATERLDHYASELPQEPAAVLPNDPTTVEHWPTEGAIVLSNVSAAYPSRPDHLVLQDLSLSIRGGEKIGIVGRTGSGKTTLVSILFRMLEVSKGDIFIDDRNVATLGLSALRSNMQMVSQDPVLFTGSVRSNMQLPSQGPGRVPYTDDQLWEALTRVGLADFVASTPEKLDAPVLENGSNLSLGQRQLLCLANAVLAGRRVLVLDESTASLDETSSKRVAECVATCFQHATVIAVAHRLNSIAGYDRVVVMDGGRIVECDKPHVLLGRADSAFRKLADATGPSNAAVLEQIAQEAYLRGQ
ncbi:Multidrug resistance-associated protein 1 [Thoreauomyces humboldtii]|nr:Multidrug resistance-associated protein 1 [Thoreauomyces humboldtii]